MLNKESLLNYYTHYQLEDYFECHEILEDTWKEEVKPLVKSHSYVCLIQLAVALFHLKNENIKGFEKTLINLKRNYSDLKIKDELELYFNFKEIIEQLFVLKKYKHLNLIIR